MSTPAWDSRKTYATNREAVLYDGKPYRQNDWNVDARPDQNPAQYG
jgi:hypothetical protein